MTHAQDWQAARFGWFKWNLNRTGKERHSIGKLSWDGPVFYIDGTPSQRLVKGPRGHVLLCRYGAGEIPMAFTNDITASVIVPDIAVFSVYSGDWYDEPEEIHARVKYISLMRVNNLVEDYRGCISKQFEGKHFTDSYERTMKMHYKHWDDYDSAFRLGWGSLPNHYFSQLMAIKEQKLTEWRDPANVKKRERAAARKAAKSALGLL